MGYETIDFYIKDSSPLHKPVSAVLVKVFSEDGRLFHTQAQTDVEGHAGFLLAAGFTYQVRFYKQQVSFTNPLFFEALAPPSPNVFDIPAELVTPPTASDPRLCTAYGFFRTLTGAQASNVGIHFIAKFKPLLLDGAGVLTERVLVRTDEEGYAQVNLIRCGQYDVTLQGFEDYVHKITVPDAPNVNLPDLLFPVVASVVFEPAPPYDLPVGTDIQVSPTIVATDGEVLVGLAMDDVVWSSSNKAVLDVLPVGQKVTLRGVGAGVASIQVKRANYSIIRYPDLPISGQPALVTVS
jgi:hypothetical protein